MIVAVDDAIPYWQEAFAEVGELRPFSGRKLQSSHLRDVDALVVRSVTRVDSALLDGSRVRFVGTATIGMDHMDLEYLRARGIFFVNAAGSNANAVAEYVVAALEVVAARRSWILERKSLAIIGVGNVGSRVERKARALGMSLHLCDPPLRESTGDPKYLFLDDVLEADILTFHVPLTTDGPYPTWHMLDGNLLGRLPADKFLINTSRGPVFSEPYLRAALANRKLGGAVLDVWESEPRIDYSLMELIEIGSPHIAGYSLDGKVRATEMILEALCGQFGVAAAWDNHGLFPEPVRLGIPRGLRAQEAIRTAVLQAYDILRDDQQLRELRLVNPEQAALGFDRLRNEYPLRAEFRHFIVELPQEYSPLASTLRELGFQVRDMRAG